MMYFARRAKVDQTLDLQHELCRIICRTRVAGVPNLITPPIPQDEALRLQTLREYDILDSLEEQAFNDITFLASWICSAPIAVITLIDTDRQWFKAKVGVQATQTPREHAFCAHAILEPQTVLVVNDATADPRFSGNPLVTGEPRIRFYAGAPLVAPNGQALGTMCVVDQHPRDIDADRVMALQALSRQVMSQMELRRVMHRMSDYQGQIESANALLRASSLTDMLTGVRNRRAFDLELDMQLTAAARSGLPVSLLMIDVDHFKRFNDTYGHLSGDAALRRVAGALSGQARTSDTAARYGGEEFAMILPGTDAASALLIGERLRQAIVHSGSEGDPPLTASIGAATTVVGLTAHQLIEQADGALYQAKREGRNRVRHAEQLKAEA